ncbi:MAG: helix-turn-helix domain containing protein [bacterium]|nr:helix-turn-helix domain containing protein [bacterium]
MDNLRNQRKISTRRTLLQVARGLFGRSGYGGTGTEEVVAASRVTRGALYHHFRDKRDLFQAVFEDLDLETAEKALAAAQGAGTPWEALSRAAGAFLDAALDPTFQRIALRDAPAVLGAAANQENRVSETLQGLLRRTEAAGHLSLPLIGTLHEAAREIARSDSPEAARQAAGSALAWLIDAMKKSSGEDIIPPS